MLHARQYIMWAQRRASLNSPLVLWPPRVHAGVLSLARFFDGQSNRAGRRDMSDVLISRQHILLSQVVLPPWYLFETVGVES